MSSNTHPHAFRALTVVVATVLVAGAFAPVLSLAARVIG